MREVAYNIVFKIIQGGMKGADGVWQLRLKRAMDLGYVSLAIFARGTKCFAGLNELVDDR